MSRLLTCLRGHQWEAPAGTDPVESGPGGCPLCGPETQAHPPPAAAAGPPIVSLHATVVPVTGDQRVPVPSPLTPARDLYATRAGPAAAETDSREAAVPAVTDGQGPARYELLGELGQGAMGVVYKARQTGLNRLVALKMILPGAHDRPEDRARLRAEAEAVARLQHPNIVQVYETGEYEGRPYFSMELVDGTSLREALAGAPQPAGPAAALAETLARAMHAAHRRGIVHRDLKPANILLAFRRGPGGGTVPALPSGARLGECVPKITDFGIAKKFEEDSGLTRAGAIMGTPSYMAPEQANGRGDEVGPPADVYALGAILYELLTGRPPFYGSTVVETLDQVRWQEPVAPRALQPKVPRDLETICLKCLGKEPGQRYGSAEELAEDLRRFQANEPIKARPASARERLAKWVRRRPADAALCGVSGAAFVVLGVLTLWHYHDVRAQRDEARAGERHAQEEKRAAEEGRRLAELRAKVQERLARGRAARDRKDWQNARELLAGVEDQIHPEASLTDLQTEAAGLRQEIDRRQRARDDYLQFGRRSDEALLYETLSAGQETAGGFHKTADAAREALALFGVTVPSGSGPVIPDQYFSAEERAEIREGCYQLLFIWAAAVAHPLPGQEPSGQARQALAGLKQAAGLRGPTRAYHLRMAHYLAQLGDAAGADEERRQAQAVPPAGPLDYFLLGEDHYQRGDLGAAIHDFSEALQLQPRHFWARYFLAACYLNASPPRPDLARASLDACLVQRRDIPWVYLLRGFAQSELHDFEAAEADFREAEKHELDPAAAYGLSVNRGVLRLREAVAAEPAARLRYAGALLPTLLPCQVCGQVARLRQEQQLAAAVADLRHAIDLKPEQYQAHVNLAQVFEYQQQWGSAAAQVSEAVRLEPGLALLYRERAQVRLRQHDPAAALHDLDQAIAREAAGSLSQAADLVQKGRVLSDGRRYAEAVMAYDAALATHPDHADALLGRAEALLKLGRYPEAIRAMGRYEAKAKPPARFYRTRGLARAKVGDEKGAVDDYTRALLMAPDAATYVHRGWAYLLAYGSPRQALADFEDAIRLDPGNAEAYSGRGNSRFQLSRSVGDAVADAETALRLGPRSDRVQYGAARIFAQVTGRIDALGVRDPERRSAFQDRALQHLRRAAALFPAAQRAAFWHDCVTPDSAFTPIRSSPGYSRLAAECARPGPAE